MTTETLLGTEQLGLGQIPCPKCGDSNPTNCYCGAVRAFFRHWSSVPSRWKYIHLDNLEIDETNTEAFSIERQIRAIETLKQYPNDSYLFFGEHGTGKTHYLYSLYRHALTKWAANPNRIEGLACWTMKASNLLDQASAHRQDPHLATAKITPELIRRIGNKGLRPCLFLDEVDKFPSSDSKLDFLSSIIDATYEENGQIALTSNLDPTQLTYRWGNYGPSILRRVCFPPHGHQINFTAAPIEKEK